LAAFTSRWLPLVLFTFVSLLSLARSSPFSQWMWPFPYRSIYAAFLKAEHPWMMRIHPHNWVDSTIHYVSQHLWITQQRSFIQRY
jgi:hypothetical protein